jgi:hypothetical protein
MVEDFLMFGNAEDVAASLQPYRTAGLEHVVLCDLTGFTYAPEEAAGFIAELARLTKNLQNS